MSLGAYGRDLLHPTIVELIQNHEGRTTDLLIPKVLYASLPLLDGVDNHVA